METIQELMILLLILIPTAGAVRIILCGIYMATAEDTASYKKRIRNTLVFIVLAETVTGVMTLVANYFGDVIY